MLMCIGATKAYFCDLIVLSFPSSIAIALEVDGFS